MCLLPSGNPELFWCFCGYPFSNTRYTTSSVRQFRASLAHQEISSHRLNNRQCAHWHFQELRSDIFPILWTVCPRDFVFLAVDDFCTRRFQRNQYTDEEHTDTHQDGKGFEYKNFSSYTSSSFLDMQLPIYKTEKNEYSVLREQKIYLLNKCAITKFKSWKLLIFI